ncbi:MAG: TIM barrel protein, partial [Prolixibacteraceae bacterium]|nr:TIM barrel protein [Prolixibacteraceae bacterium]
MANRREFIRNASLLVAAGMLAKPAFSEIAAAPKSKKSIGLQLYSLRDAMGKDARGTLQKVSKMGYKTLETASYGDGKIYGFAPKDFKTYVKDLGMKVTGAHLGGPNYTRETHDRAMEWWKKAIEDHKIAGITYLIKPSMPLPNNLKDLQMWCEFYNILGKEVSKNGLKFGFHNHDGEFKVIEGQIMYDYMIQNTDPKNVLFEMDVYWVKRGGHNPIDY